MIIRLDQPREYLTEPETAEILACSVKTLQGWRWTGKGPPFCKVGRLVRYKISDLEEWLDGCRRRSTSDTGTMDERSGR